MEVRNNELLQVQVSALPGSELSCTCDYEQRLEAIYQEYAKEFGHMGCKPECLLEKPNFHYKPTDYRLKWYKYPLRDSYANKEVTVTEFARMIDHCIASLRKEKD